LSTLANMLRELVGLFVDDGALALTIVAVVVVAGGVATLMPEVPLAAGGHLVVWLSRWASLKRRKNRPPLIERCGSVI
jgi:hypothetical protein